MYNLSGQQVNASIKKLLNYFVVTTQDLPTGIYTLILDEESNKTESIKFVVEH